MRTRFAIVGYGHIGRRHAAIVHAHPGAELAAVCEIGALSTESLPANVPVYDDLSRMLAERVFDVACICTPNGLHAAQAVACLEAGRHVIIEKPLALTVADCDRIIATAAARDRRVFGVMQNRYSPASVWLKELMEAGRLGDVLQVHVNCFWNRDGRYYGAGNERHSWHGHRELDGGVLFTQFAHFVDLLCWTFGAVEVIAARAANQTHRAYHDFPDSGMVHFRLPGGGFGSMNYSTVIYGTNFESTLSVIGSRGTVKLGGQYMNEVRYCHVADVAVPDLPRAAPPNDYGGYQGSAANHHHVIDNAIRVLRGEAEVATPATEGREVVRFITEVHRMSEPV